MGRHRENKYCQSEREASADTTLSIISDATRPSSQMPSLQSNKEVSAAEALMNKCTTATIKIHI